jgi:hypothetical protein
MGDWTAPRRGWLGPIGAADLKVPPYFFTVSVPLTGMPQTVPLYVTTTWPGVSCVALLLAKVNGQLTPPWATRPLALQLIVDPDSVPEPEPFTAMLLAQVAVKLTFALVAVVGVIVYFRLPHPVGGVLAVTDCQVPAKVSSDAVAGVVGDVGVEGVSVAAFFGRRSHPAVARHATKSGPYTRCERARLILDFMYRLS